ncbi:unnamed protein product [Arabis nemorensis]|uniref:ATP-dependent RNA helicase n=1 Tax=Arabis nemorensis TaxID=586526 RepID=A0A565BI35_9BRAS|nr:unnamed protein product [Arabis nemorensis]
MAREEDDTAAIETVPVVPWMRTPIDVTHVDSCALESLPCLNPRLKKALENIGISSLFPVQVSVWHETIGPGGFERDICVNSPTGSGKTLAYALPIVQNLESRAVRCIRALVVLPTRDLALQVKNVFNAIAPAVGLSVGLAMGQSSISDEISKLIKTPKLDAGICYDPEDLSESLESAVDILVATPGRLMDHINNTKGFTLEHLRFLVVDETDRLLREAYQSWLPTVLQLTQTSDNGLFPSSTPFIPSAFGSLQTVRRQSVERGFKGKPYPRLVKMALSATLTKDPSKLIQLDLHHPLFMTTGKGRYKLPEKLECLRLICETGMKPVYLVALLKSWEGEKCIVFTSSVEKTRRLCKLLNFFDDLNIKVEEYSGGRDQSDRSKQLKAFRKGVIQVLVASDALTRGMDVKGVTNVINYDVPPYSKTFVHRAGRTARAGQAGRCFTLLSDHEVRGFSKILKKVGNDSCRTYTFPPTTLNPIRVTYERAGKVVLITGASSGIGEHVAYEYAKKGANLALVARREDRLEIVAETSRQLGSRDVLIICGDVTKVDDCMKFVHETISHFGKLDHLISNAGISQSAMFEDFSRIQDAHPIMDTNFWGSTYITYYAIPHLRKSKGKIIVISSAVAKIAFPLATVYSASKAALLGFYEALRAELNPEIKVTLVLPGLISTDMTTPQIIERFGSDLILSESVSSCAKAIFQGVCRGESYIEEPSWIKWLFLVKAMCPEVIISGLNYSFMHFIKPFYKHD